MYTGSGGNFGIYLDSEMTDGTSGPCATFGSEGIASDEDFETLEIELWEFKFNSM